MSTPIFEGDGHSPRQRRICPLPTGDGRRGDLCLGGRAEQTADPMSLYNIADLHHPSQIQGSRSPNTVDGCRLSHPLSHLQM